MSDENERRIIKTMRCGCGMMMEPVSVRDTRNIVDPHAMKLVAKCPRCGNEEKQMSALAKIIFPGSNLKL